MLPRLAHIQGVLGANEQDELIGSLARQVTALQLIVDMYIKKFGVLPELGGPQPEASVPEPEIVPAESTRRPFLIDGDTLEADAPPEDDDGHASSSE